jgi:hypothetical protein
MSVIHREPYFPIANHMPTFYEQVKDVKLLFFSPSYQQHTGNDKQETDGDLRNDQNPLHFAVP